MLRQHRFLWYPPVLHCNFGVVFANVNVLLLGVPLALQQLVNSSSRGIVYLSWTPGFSNGRPILKYIVDIPGITPGAQTPGSPPRTHEYPGDVNSVSLSGLLVPQQYTIRVPLPPDVHSHAHLLHPFYCACPLLPPPALTPTLAITFKFMFTSCSFFLTLAPTHCFTV